MAGTHTHTHTSWHTYTDREGAAGLGQGHSPLLLWPIDSGLVLHFGHNAGLCTKYTHIQLSSDTDLQAHSYARTQKTTPARSNNADAARKEGFSDECAVSNHLLSQPLSQAGQVCLFALCISISLSRHVPSASSPHPIPSLPVHLCVLPCCHFQRGQL